MFRRRRPLLRAAAVGGGAYIAGKHVARRRAEGEQQEYDQNQRIDDLEQRQAPAAPRPAGARPGGACGAVDDRSAKSARGLHQQGALTDDEFASAKAKLLGI